MHVDAVETARMAIYLNAVAGGHSIEKFWGDGARFVSAPGGNVIGRDPLEWLSTIKECRGFSVMMRSDKRFPKLPIWFHASHWTLKAYSASGAAEWRPSYDIQTEPGSARRLWVVSYYPDEGGDAPVGRLEIAEIMEQLSAVLKSLIALTSAHIPAWQDTFVGLLATLEGRKPMRMDPQLPQDVLADLPSRLIGTVFAAHLFTGMGNWGDNVYDDDIQSDVERLTAVLFHVLAEALPVAVDTTRPKGF